ncbi:hypothetical protein TWF696_006043 [Orbilia brochopaga]|uniref:Uncharacterized protein n=1 Tax=Orbilia brochopaga TaxID=3140254 RepID=A0AAV9UV48_9PEZI
MQYKIRRDLQMQGWADGREGCEADITGKQTQAGRLSVFLLRGMNQFEEIYGKGGGGVKKEAPVDAVEGKRKGTNGRNLTTGYDTKQQRKRQDRIADDDGYEDDEDRKRKKRGLEMLCIQESGAKEGKPGWQEKKIRYIKRTERRNE